MCRIACVCQVVYIYVVSSGFCVASLKPTLSVLGYCRFFSLPFEKRASGRKHMWPPPHLSKRLQVREGFRSVGPSFVRSFVRSSSSSPSSSSSSSSSLLLLLLLLLLFSWQELPEQVVLFLEKLLERETLSHNTLRQLDKCYNFAGSNAEVCLFLLGLIARLIYLVMAYNYLF